METSSVIIQRNSFRKGNSSPQRRKERRSSFTCCNKDDTAMEALAIAKYRQRHTGGVAKPLYAAKAAKPLW